ncbi:LacI family DNA-binding transcriptional regulator [Burkholderia sp. BCC0044]|uniref:LacI family DNA-binding transcriptional regulator n=1 Tax=Burkholderia sp. BCC0044 TaxID=2676295 RepID=UPI00158BFBE2|nr:LacI family DNA-binding transcriptional regulator [Burkholderia sp. BCC0044]
MYPTMADVANEAGVGLATVDRVINKRASVRPETAQRVLEAAEKLGFNRAGLIRLRISEHTEGRKLGFLLLKRSIPFYREMGEALEAAAQAQKYPQAKAVIEFLEELTPRHIVSRLHEMSRKVDAIAVVAADHPQISHAIDQISAQGTPVFALISDLSTESRAGFVGIDQRKIGHTAAWAISSLSRRPGKIALMVGSHRYLCQEQAEISFRAYMREYAPDFQVLETLISLEDIDLAQEATLDLLKRHPDLIGIFVAGGGIEGVIQALYDASASQELITVCGELTQITRQALIDGRVNMVLSHPRDWVATRLVETMCAIAQDQHPKGTTQTVLPFITYTAASV